MNLFFIERYIQKLKKENIYEFAKSKNITLTNEEINILYNSIKTNYKLFLTNPELRPKLLKEIKSQVNQQAASIIDELYTQYKNKI